MRVLILSPIPYHPHCGNGGGVICFHFLKALAARHDVHFLSFGSADQQDDSSVRAALLAFCKTVEFIPSPNAGRVKRLASRFAQAFGGPPVDAAGFRSDLMPKAIQRLTTTFGPDVVLFQFPYMAQYVGQVHGPLKVMDVQDVFFVSRLREYAAQTDRVSRFKKMLSWIAWTRYELRHYSECDLLMAISEQDEAALHALVPDVPAFTSPAAIQVSAATEIAHPTKDRIGFGGNFGHPPNVDALRWLIREIAPAVAAQCPNVEFRVVGKGLPDDLLANAHPSVCFEGFVKDYAHFVRSCSAMVAPLRFGGGVKIKVLESLAYGRPVFATPIGAEGIPLSDTDGLFCARTADEMVEQLVAHLREPEAALRAATVGAQRIADLYGVERKVERFEAEVEALQAQNAGAATHGPVTSDAHEARI